VEEEIGEHGVFIPDILSLKDARYLREPRTMKLPEELIERLAEELSSRLGDLLVSVESIDGRDGSNVRIILRDVSPELIDRVIDVNGLWRKRSASTEYSSLTWCLLMSHKGYLRKSKVLLKETEIDFNNGCYNKTISALWFSIEAFIKAILLFNKRWIPSKTGKLISVFSVFIQENFPRKMHLIKEISRLYAHRNNVDHSSRIYDPNTVKNLYNKAKLVLLELEEISRKSNMQKSL